ncbi:MAG: 7TM diverse intracellular signaling domain-containing protein [Burkholderiaceae bacterium]
MRALLFGFVLAIVLFNLLISVIAKDRVFAMNALTVSSVVLLDVYLSGYGVAHFWPNAWSNTLFNVGLGTTCVLAAMFIREFLGGRNRARAPLRLLGLLMWLAPIVVASQLVLPYWAVQAVLLVILALLLLTISVAIVALALGKDPRARLLVLPFGLIILPGPWSAT